MAPELAALDKALPGLAEALRAIPLTEQDARAPELFSAYKDAGGPGVGIPAAMGGGGRTGRELVRVQRAVGYLAPSLAIATTMHQFSVLTIVVLAERSGGPEALLLEGIARENLLVASGFAEGVPGRGILQPTMRAVPDPGGGHRLTGSKRPCSLTWSMDLLTASALVDEGGESRLGVFLVPADSEGIDRRPFWGTPVLAGAESDEVVLDSVHVPEGLAFFPELTDGPDPIHAVGFAVFETLISASYLGVTSSLVDELLESHRGSPSECVGLVSAVEAAAASLEQVAGNLGAVEDPEAMLARSLYVRYGTEAVLEQVAMRAAALLGGMAFVRSPSTAYRLAAARALAFHPPSLPAGAGAVDTYLRGGPLRMDQRLK